MVSDNKTAVETKTYQWNPTLMALMSTKIPLSAKSSRKAIYGVVHFAGYLWKVTLTLNVCRGGFAFSIIPALRKIHGNNKRDYATALKNHLQFFNASPKLFTFLLGTAVAMEENKEKPSTVNVMKVAGMGPTGGIGDAIDHMTLMPLTLALGASIAMEGSIAGPFVFFFVPNCSLFVYFGLMFMGYRAGTAAMVNMSDATEN